MVARSARPRRSPRMVAALAGVILLLVTMAPANAGSKTGGSTSEPTCPSASDLVPQLRDLTVNQGTDDYTTLARGKRTLVRAYLSKPACAGSDDRVAMTSATLTWRATGSVDGVTLPLGEGTVPADLSAEVELPSWALAPVGGTSPSDPIFVLPDAALAPPTWLDGFALEVSVTVSYRNGLDGADLGDVLGPLAFEGETRAVGPDQRPLRVLVVPLVEGDAGPEFDAVASTVAAAMDTLNRQLPVPTGTSDLEGAGGIRYTIHPTGVDLRTMGPDGDFDMLGDDGLFCNGFWPYIRRSLEDLRASYNILEPNTLRGTRVDRVLGVVPGGIVDPSCGTRGWAQYPGTVGYVLAVPSDTTPTAGALSVLELGHTLHLVDPGSPNADVDPVTGVGDESHSKNTEAELVDRAFDTHAVAAVTHDRSVMRYVSTEDWNDRSTLLEAREWLYALCRLTPGAAVGGITCPWPTGLVGDSAAASDDRFVLVGSTDGTPEGTLADSYEPDAGVSEATDDASPYRLVQRTGGTIHRSDGVPVSTAHSSHDDHDRSGTGSDLDHFGISVPSPADAETFELWRGDPAGATAAELDAGSTASGALRLHRRDRGDDPVITSTSVAATPQAEEVALTASPELLDAGAALSPDGEFLAWSAGGALVTGRVRELEDDPASATVSAIGDVAEVAWNASGDRLAYTTIGGDVHVVPFDRQTEQLGEPRPVYFPSDGAVTWPATGPTWSPDDGADDATVAVAVNGDIWELRTDGVGVVTPVCARLGVTTDACPRLVDLDVPVGAPSWSDRGLVYGCADDVCLHGTEPTVLEEGAGQPTWGGDQLAYVRDGVVEVATVTAAGTLDHHTVGRGDGPTMNEAGGTKLAYARDGDLFLRRSRVRTFTVRATDDTPGTLRAVFTVECASVGHALTGFLGPDATQGDEVTFSYTVDASRLCAGGAVRVLVTDGVGITIADLTVVGENHAPTVAVIEPRTLTIGQWDPLVLVAAGTDVDGDPVELTWRSETLGVETTGSHPAPLAAPQAGWPVTPDGSGHELTVTASDGTDEHGETLRVVVLADRDGDRVPDGREACLGEDAPGDASNVFDDPDQDGVPNAVDDDLCSPATDLVVVDFEPDTLYVPSAGDAVSVRVPAVAAAGADPTRVAIRRLGGWPVDLPALSWSIERKDGTGVAKFDRQLLTSLLAERGLVGSYVPILVHLEVDGRAHRGLDLSHPVTAPNP